jgi:hypothetical protein
MCRFLINGPTFGCSQQCSCSAIIIKTTSCLPINLIIEALSLGAHLNHDKNSYEQHVAALLTISRARV